MADADPWARFNPTVAPNADDPWAKFSPVSDRPSWSQAIGNIPSDIGKTVQEIASIPGAIGSALSHPGETLANIGSAIGHGIVNQGRQIAGAATFGNVGETTEEAVARGEAARKQAIERPLTTVANIALSGVPSGELTAGQGILKGLTATTREAANIPAFVAAGVGRKSSNAMLKAGELGGAEGAAARAAMTGGDPLPIANQALNAAGQLATDKNAAYLANKAGWNTGAMVDLSSIDQALADARAANSTATTGAARNSQAAAALDRIDQVIEAHRTIPGTATPSGKPTRLSMLPVEDADALKQAIGEVMYDRNMAPAGSHASVHAGGIYDAAKNAITAVSPEYGKAMEESQQTIRNLKDLRQELSLKPNASKATILGKLQSAMRNDVSSRFGARGQMLDQLATKEPTLPYALAGQDFSSPYPRGLSKLVPAMGGTAGAYGVLTGAAAINPLNALIGATGLAASSPRLHGELRYLAGLLTRGARNVGATQQNIGRGVEASRLAGLLMNQQGSQ